MRPSLHEILDKLAEVMDEIIDHLDAPESSRNNMIEKVAKVRRSIVDSVLSAGEETK